jgi:putative membrane protein
MPESSLMSVASEPTDLRVFYAAERTLLAWIRTGLAMMGFGFVVARFGLFLRELAAVRGAERLQQGGLSLWFGIGLVLLGVTVNLLAGCQYVHIVRQLHRGEYRQPRVLSMGVVVAALLAALGLAMAAYLLATGYH